MAAADIELSDEKNQALRAASDGFHPVTGRAAFPRMVRARLGR